MQFLPFFTRSSTSHPLQPPVSSLSSSMGGSGPPGGDVNNLVGVSSSIYPQINPIDKLYLMHNSYFEHWRSAPAQGQPDDPPPPLPSTPLPPPPCPPQQPSPLSVGLGIPPLWHTPQRHPSHRRSLLDVPPLAGVWGEHSALQALNEGGGGGGSSWLSSPHDALILRNIGSSWGGRGWGHSFVSGTAKIINQTPYFK